MVLLHSTHHKRKYDAFLGDCFHHRVCPGGRTKNTVHLSFGRVKSHPHIKRKHSNRCLVSSSLVCGRLGWIFNYFKELTIMLILYLYLQCYDDHTNFRTVLCFSVNVFVCKNKRKSFPKINPMHFRWRRWKTNTVCADKA